MSLRRLGVERIDLFQLHRIDPRFQRRPIWSAERSPEGRQGTARWPFRINVAEIEAARRIVYRRNRAKSI